MQLNYYDTSPYYIEAPQCVHGRHRKDMIVLHETISGDSPGLADIIAVERSLIAKGYGIHGMTDKQGNIAWARGFGDAIFYQCGGVNERSIGIEQVSNPPYPDSPKSRSYWRSRNGQIRATAKLVAAISKTWNVPLVYSNGDHPGITTHWSVSKIYPESLGHTDCFPVHLGGYYPALYVINLAKLFRLGRLTL